MNQIKFRAWDEGNKVMHYNFQWISSGGKGNDWIVFTSDKQPVYDEAIKNPYFSQQLKKMQFTGLKLKHQRELYYGDIVKHNKNVFVVCFRENFGFCLIDAKRYNPDNTKLMTKDNWRTYEDVYRMAKYCEIIGNIYETPELINQTRPGGGE